MKILNCYFYFLTWTLILLSVNQIQAQRDYTFEGGDTGNPTNYFSPSNWTCTITPCTFPGADDTARIGKTVAGGYTIYSPRALGTANVKNLFILNGSSLNFTDFTTTGTFNLGDLPTSSGTIANVGSGGVFNNNGTMSIITTTGPHSVFSGNFTFFNNGTFNLNKLLMSGGPTIVNQPFASIFIGDFLIGGNSWTFNNLGFLNKPSSPGTATLNLVNFTNSGSVEVGNGILELGASGSTLTGKCGRFRTLAVGATIKFLTTLTVVPCTTFSNLQPAIRNPQSFDPGDTVTSFRGEGLIEFTGDLVLNSNATFGFAHPTSGAITGGNVTLTGNISGGGNLRLVADAQNPTIFNWNNGGITGAGTLVIDNGATFNINPPPSGSVNLTQRDITNNGFTRWTGGNIGGFGAGFVFNNSLSGVFEIHNDRNLVGSFSTLPIFNNAGIFRKTLTNGTTNISTIFNNTGLVDVQSGTLRFTSTAPNSNSLAGTFNATNGGVIEFTSSSGGFNFNSGFNFTGAGVLRLVSGASALVSAPINISNLELQGGTINGTGLTNNLKLIALLSRFENGSTLNNTRITNQGSLLLQSNVFFNNSTTLENQGTINAPHNTSLRQQAGGAFNFVNGGIFNPGLAQALGVVFMDGNYTQSGTLNIDIGGTTPGTQHDQLRVFNGTASGTGNVNLSGTLNVNFVNGFTPSAGQFFQIMTCQTACNGQFQQINGVNLSGGNILIPGYGTNAVSLITTPINGSINAPVLTVAKSFAGDTLIRGVYSAAPNTTYLISFYQGCSDNAVNIGTKVFITNSSGVAELFFFTTRSIPVGEFVSARATDASNQTSNLSNCKQVIKSPNFADFDGDLRTDLSIFRSNNNFSEFVPGLSEWWIQRSTDNVTIAYQFGTPTDKITPGDYDGDGKTDVALWRPSTGEWFVLRSSNLTFFAAPFGVSSDKPAPADFDGDGKTDFAVFRPSQTTWYINKTSGGVDIIPFGLSNDIPQPADYDGDGKSDIAIFRPVGGSGQSEWWILRSTGGNFATPFGTSTDKPVVGDYTGDGKADIAFWRPSTGEWFVLRSEDLSFYAAPFGVSGDIPTPGDYDGDGKTDFAVFRPSTTNWFILKSSGGTLIQTFGLSQDIPVPAAFVP